MIKKEKPIAFKSNTVGKNLLLLICYLLLNANGQSVGYGRRYLEVLCLCWDMFNKMALC